MMLKGLKGTWRDLRRGEPGSRFQDYHKSQQAARRGKWSRPLCIAGGILLVVFGILAIPTPIIPGSVPITLGAALIARESLGLAHALDWLEVRGRQVLRFLVAGWKQASAPEKVVACVSGVAIVGVTIAWVYSLTFGA